MNLSVKQSLFEIGLNPYEITTYLNICDFVSQGVVNLAELKQSISKRINVSESTLMPFILTLQGRKLIKVDSKFNVSVSSDYVLVKKQI